MKKLIKVILVIFGITAVCGFVRHEKDTLKQIRKNLMDLR